MSQQKLSKQLRDELNAAAFKADYRDLRGFILHESVETIESLIPNEKQRHTLLTDMALNDSAPTFRILLSKFSQDEGAMKAILGGFKKDDAYHNHADYDGSYDDIKAKRLALRELAISIQKSPTNTAGRNAP